jgi:hypothetical protein
MYDSPMGYHRQIAIGLNQKATNGFDLGYDAFIADVNEEDMYWTFAGHKFVIQGVNTFDKHQRFPLELIVKEPGTVKIRLDGSEHVDSNLELYIKDNVTGQTYQINDKPFETYLEPGVYSDRFSLVFKQSKRKIPLPHKINQPQDFSVYYDSKASELNILLEKDMDVSKVELYNFVGHKTTELKITSQENIIPIQLDKGIYIVRLYTAKGILNKKILIK